MKKIVFALTLVAFSVLSLASCRSKEKCDAYRSSTPAHNKTVRF